MSTNELIITNLQALLKEAQSSKEQKDRFRAKAYRNAIKQISGCGYELASGKDAMQLDGIGQKIAEKIQEIIDTGKLHQVNTTQLEQTKTQTNFTKVWGIGPVKAQELWDAGARTIKDLHKKKYNSLLNDNQKIGLEYYNDLQKRVPRSQVAEIAEQIDATINQIQDELGWRVKHVVCGSFRRKAATCGDMDILLCEKRGHPILTELVDRLTMAGVLIEKLGIGTTKYLGITRVSDGTAFRIDMEVIKPIEWPFALLYFTGSGSFNERQRLIAKKKGYRLSEHGLKDVKTGGFVPGLTSERKIFEFLEMEYLPPWDR